MSQSLKFIAAAAALALAGCVSNGGEPTGGPVVPLIGTSGQQLGTVSMWQSPGGVAFRVHASGLSHGIHGIHVHAVGRCDAPDFTTAGAHWNPTARSHGFNNPAGHHGGDLPNVPVAANGTLNESVTLSGASFASLIDADGAALVIHATADDYRTDPSGNSGARIACGIFG